jgi:hypothetical protein
VVKSAKYIHGLRSHCGRQCLSTVFCFVISSYLISPCVSAADNIASVVRWLKTAGRNVRGRKRPWPDLGYYSDHLLRVTKDSMKNVSFGRGVSHLQMMEHFSLRHHPLYHHDHHDDYDINGCDVDGEDCCISFRYGLLICPPNTIWLPDMKPINM